MVASVCGSKTVASRASIGSSRLRRRADRALSVSPRTTPTTYPWRRPGFSTIQDICRGSPRTIHYKRNENVFPFVANLASLEVLQFVSFATGISGLPNDGFQRYRSKPGIMTLDTEASCKDPLRFRVASRDSRHTVYARRTRPERRKRAGGEIARRCCTGVGDRDDERGVEDDRTTVPRKAGSTKRERESSASLYASRRVTCGEFERLEIECSVYVTLRFLAGEHKKIRDLGIPITLFVPLGG